MSRFYDSFVDVLSHCCGHRRERRHSDRLSYHCDATDFDDGPAKVMRAKGRLDVLTPDPVNNNQNSVKGYHLHHQRNLFPPIGAANKRYGLETSDNESVMKVSTGNLMTEVQDKLYDGLMKIFSETLESLVFVMCPVGKARRKEKDTGPSSGVGAGNDEGKLYLEAALLERHLNETDLIRLVGMPTGLEKNEWMASHTIALFEHVNLIYGTISEFCTPTSCPDMTGPCMRTYLWFDERGKKVKVAAPQYIDYVMTFIQKTINDESLFPTKSTNAFPSSFQDIVKKICRLMFHVIAHIYHCHFKEIVLLSMHAHLNCVFAHFMTFNELFKLVEEKETEILQDLSLAMKLRSDLSDDDPMSDSNKENIIVTKSSSSFPHDSSDPSSTVTSSSAFNPSDDSLLIKEPALVNAVSDSQ
ncbi:unnamed protein product [Allacma fusca]|uniref:MOB kinase activator-like 2 n=1 Tax=Allacma fusca TaxID=39272 RepID=A0A8J2KN25_9HEXA|nr:unnamed protein product [Allacma fusca]